MIEPKPCPFCGKTKITFTSESGYYELLGKNGMACIAIRCEKCHVDMYEHTDSIRNYEKKLEKLIKKWNRRVHNADGKSEVSG